MSDFEPLPFPELRSDNLTLEHAYRIAMGDLLSNIRPYKAGLLTQEEPVILAGLDYNTPWTRDAAINVWNGAGLLWPETSRQTLLSVLEQGRNGPRIGGQYWDAIIWSIGAWAYYLYTGDRVFLRTAHAAICSSLEYFEVNEFDPDFGLFRGPAVLGDGVAAYPDRYSPGGTSAILDWPKLNPDKRSEGENGIPMMALSTNCLYVEAYLTANRMAAELGIQQNPVYQECAAALVDRIQHYFWDGEDKRYRYLVDLEGGSDAQEGLGISFAMLFGIASPEQSMRILDTAHVTPQGIPCVWPSFERYLRMGGYGRHSGPVWPFVSGFWAEAAARNQRFDLAGTELLQVAGNIARDGQCAEIYHPETGLPYGGLQEAGWGTSGYEWKSCLRQSWTASGFFRMIIKGILGMRFGVEGITFEPFLPEGVHALQLSGLRYQNSLINISVRGSGTQLSRYLWKGTETRPFLPSGLRGEQHIEMELIQPG